jgi:hypothetical protein
MTHLHIESSGRILAQSDVYDRGGQLGRLPMSAPSQKHDALPYLMWRGIRQQLRKEFAVYYPVFRE